MWSRPPHWGCEWATVCQDEVARREGAKLVKMWSEAASNSCRMAS